MVASGRIIVAGFSRDGPVLIQSRDGRDWTLESDSIEGAAPGMLVAAVANGPPGSVLLVNEGPPEGRVMGVRFSVDGNDWRQVARPVFEAETRVTSVDVVWTGGEFVAVGSRPSGGDDPLGEAVVFSSPDGVSWASERSEVLVLEGLFPAPTAIGSWHGEAVVVVSRVPGGGVTLLTRHAQGTWSARTPPETETALIESVHETPAGLLLGGCELSDFRTRATVWLAPAGPEGMFVPAEVSGDASCVLGLASGPRGFLAVGQADRRAAAWSSDDGVTWIPDQPAAAFESGGPAEIKAVVGRGREWIAVGQNLLDLILGTQESFAIWQRP